MFAFWFELGGAGKKDVDLLSALLVGGQESKRMIRNQQRMRDGLDSNGGRRGHAGAKQQFVVVDRDLRKVGDHIVGGGGVCIE
jgi:hypothetical protein